MNWEFANWLSEQGFYIIVWRERIWDVVSPYAHGATYYKFEQPFDVDDITQPIGEHEFWF
jgi:hypothetical protein